MIEKFTEDELRQIVKEIKEQKVLVNSDKAYVLRGLSEKVYGKRIFIGDDISSGIFGIADFLTDNYERRPRMNTKVLSRFRRKSLPKGREEEYKKICEGILKVIEPYAGMVGFR